MIGVLILLFLGLGTFMWREMKTIKKHCERTISDLLTKRGLQRMVSEAYDQSQDRLIAKVNERLTEEIDQIKRIFSSLEMKVQTGAPLNPLLLGQGGGAMKVFSGRECLASSSRQVSSEPQPQALPEPQPSASALSSLPYSQAPRPKVEAPEEMGRLSLF
jgi:hypothetical protein